MKKESTGQIEIQGRYFPIKIISEFRRNARVSLGSKEVLVRIPNFGRFSDRDQILNWVKDYLHQLYDSKPSAFYKYIPVDYGARNTLSTFDQDFSVSIVRHKHHNRIYAKLNQGQLQIKLSVDHSTSDPSIGKLVANAMRQWYLPQIDQRVKAINREHLKESVGKVSLRHNSTRWGSCSTGGNISISTRCLLAPENVLNYIIIHELCHLKEMNHSASFWKLVESIDPKYKEKERWLRKYGGELRF